MRGGSKGIKNKNILKINSKYLFEYTYDIAIKCKKITNIVFSTDSDRIIKILSKDKKKTIFKRSKRLATGNIGKIYVIRDALVKAELYFNKKFHYIIDLDVTSPLRNLNDINTCINKIIKSKYNNIFSVNLSKKNPYFNMIEKKNNKYDLINNKYNIYSRQKAPKVYDMNASIYIWKRNYLLKNDNLFSENSTIYKMPYKRSVDIDNYEDLRYVKYLLEND